MIILLLILTIFGQRTESWCFSLLVFISGRVQKNASIKMQFERTENSLGGLLFLWNGILDMTAFLSFCSMDSRFVYVTAQNYLHKIRLANCTDFSFCIIIKGPAKKVRMPALAQLDPHFISIQWTPSHVLWSVGRLHISLSKILHEWTKNYSQAKGKSISRGS